MTYTVDIERGWLWFYEASCNRDGDDIGVTFACGYRLTRRGAIRAGRRAAARDARRHASKASLTLTGVRLAATRAGRQA